MLAMNEFPWSKIVSTYFTSKSNITIEEDDGDREYIDIEDIKLEQIREFYDRLNSWWKPEEVVEVLNFIQRSIVEVEDIGEDIWRELSKDCRNPQVLKSLWELAEELEKSIKIVKQQTAILMSDISHLEKKGYSLEILDDNKVKLIDENWKVISILSFKEFDLIKSLDDETIVAKKLSNQEDLYLFKSLNWWWEIKYFSNENGENSNMYNLASIIVRWGYKWTIRKMPYYKDFPENSELFFMLDLDDIESGCIEIDFDSWINYMVFSKDGEVVKNPRNKVKSNTNDYWAFIDEWWTINWLGYSN